MSASAAGWKKPLPRVDEESRGFWEACRRQELVIQRCAECGTHRSPPRAVCTACMSSRIEWVRSSGRGEVYTFSVTTQNHSPGFREELPYVLAYVELEDCGGVQLLTNVVECDPATVRIGMPVEVVFTDVSDELAIPRFRPRARDASTQG